MISTPPLTERELARIYKSDYTPMSSALIDALQIDNYVWYMMYAPKTELTDIMASDLRILGYEEVDARRVKPRKYRYLPLGTEKKELDHPPGMSDQELIEYYLKERRERSDAVET